MCISTPECRSCLSMQHTCMPPFLPMIFQTHRSRSASLCLTTSSLLAERSALLFFRSSLLALAAALCLFGACRVLTHTQSPPSSLPLRQLNCKTDSSFCNPNKQKVGSQRELQRGMRKRTHRQTNQMTRSRLHALQDGLCLLQGGHLLVHSALSDIEVLDGEVARGVHVGRIFGEASQGVSVGGEVLLGRGQVLLGLALLCGLVRHVGALGSDLSVEILHHLLVGNLSCLLVLDGLLLECLALCDDPIDHRDHPVSALVVVVGLEPGGGRGESRGLICALVGRHGDCGTGLQEGLSLRLVVGIQDLNGLHEQLLGRLGVSDSHLELVVLCLSVLGQFLDVHLGLLDLSLQNGDLSLESRDGLLEGGHLRLEILLLLLGLHRLLLVVVDHLDAPVAVLDLVGLLLLESVDHLVDLLDQLGEGLQASLDLCGQLEELCEVGPVGLFGGLGEDCAGVVPLIVHHLPPGRGLEEGGGGVEGAGEKVVGVVGGENRDGLCDGCDLCGSLLLSLLPFAVGFRALQHKVLKKLLVGSQSRPGVCDVLLGVCEVLSGLSQLSLLLSLGGGIGSNLLVLCLLKSLILFLLLCLLLLCLCQVLLEVLLHVVQNSENDPGLRSIGAPEGGRAAEISGSRLPRLGGGEKGSDGVLLILRELLRTPEAVHHVVHHRGNVQQGSFGGGVVLGEDRDRTLQCSGGFGDLGLQLSELLQLRLPDGRSLLERLVVRCDFGLQGLDLSLQPLNGCSSLVNERHDVLHSGLCCGDSFLLVLFVLFAVAVEFFVNSLIFFLLLCKCRLHVFQELDDLRDGSVDLGLLWLFAEDEGRTEGEQGNEELHG
mmetsp:Transcript_17200/g.34871  ORF Transcript_17200/g.34871 Transcript_17200/m.34871 type:complete len:828 (+) Transcript_17200:223-2706(+)